MTYRPLKVNDLLHTDERTNIMSLIKTSAIVLSTAVIALVSVGAANASTEFSDNNAPKASLDARAFFERIASDSD